MKKMNEDGENAKGKFANKRKNIKLEIRSKPIDK